MKTEIKELTGKEGDVISLKLRELEERISPAMSYN